MITLRSLSTLALSFMVFACASTTSSGAPPGPSSDCEKSCHRACDARCSQRVAQCEARCDETTSMDLGNTEKQGRSAREGNPSCRRDCSSEDQTCLRSCQASCDCP